VWRICAAAFLCAAASVSAQTVHKRLDAAGRIAYTDRPDSTPSTQEPTVPALDRKNARAPYSAMSPRRAAAIDANEAARRLAQAQLQRELGAEPLPGELARGSGVTVLNDRYWRRQEKLRSVVRQAQLRYDETRRSQLARR
jgi:hypothetical protein